ncbi:MAG TPA: M17 family peptidase N-terminal domain-containing protein, partial [bacterium]|nr:M17 family peptidase N-terminal domain-containing protein [bacterium]
MKIDLIPVSKTRTPADLFVVGLFEKEKLSKEAESLEPAFAKALKSAVDKGRFTGKFGQEFSSFRDDHREAPEIVLLGLGQKKNYKPACLRKTVGKMVQAARSRKSEKVRLFLDSFVSGNITYPLASEIIAETALLASYDFDKYKTKKDENEKKKKLETLEVLFLKKQFQENLLKSADRAQKIAQGVLLTRDLINEPANVMNPQRLA